MDREALSLCSHGGGTPPPLLALGRVTSPRHILGVQLVPLWHRCYVERVVLTIRERASTPPFTLEVLVTGIFSAAAAASGVGSMDFRTLEETSYVYVIASEYTTAQLRLTLREHRPCPVGLATVIRQVPAFS